MPTTITGFSVTFSKTLKTGDYENEKAEVTLHGETNDGKDAEGYLVDAARSVFNALGIGWPKHLATPKPAGTPTPAAGVIADGPPEDKPAARRGRPVGSTNKPKDAAENPPAGVGHSGETKKDVSAAEVVEAAAKAKENGASVEAIRDWRSEFKVDSVRDIAAGDRQEFIDGLKLLEDGKTPTRRRDTKTEEF